jgi:hypothetical protein
MTADHSGAAMRSILIVLGLALLGACNMVTTKTPLFAPSDAVGAPRLRPGLWADSPDGDCKLVSSRPLAKWPSCAHGFAVTPDTAGSYDKDSHGKLTWSTAPYLLAGGDPAVLQLRMTDADIVGPGASITAVSYVYLAIRPTKTDSAGRVTAYDGWLVLCGPPPPSDARSPDGKSARYGTLEPVPGMVMDDSGEDCTTTSSQALRTAAAASETWHGPNAHMRAHWVRDGAR